MEHKKTPPAVIAGRIIFTLCLAATVIFIFGNSAQAANVSSEASGRVLLFLQKLVTKLGHPGLASRITMHRVRKLAHFCEYMLEGFWLMLCVRVYTRHFVTHISWPILGILLTAVIDETIQMFSSGRSSQITDVWIDFAGGMTGLLCGLLVLCIVRMCVILYRHRNDEE